jgi:hypothetical protein
MLKQSPWLIGSVLLLNACLPSVGSKTYDLQFDPSDYKSATAEVNGKVVRYRAYEGIVYVQHPVDTKYQSMNIYVPEEYFEGKSIGAFTAQTAPIFLPNQVGGYMPAEPGKPSMQTRPGATTSSPNAILVALSRGYVVASPGARGRTTKDADGSYTGKAPAAIVDLKAAVRYLRYNDASMPGNAEKIISNGTSAGGALSLLLGASGNNPDYEPYLAALGAAPARDDIFAVSAYCPITNLENADAAYEWQFSGVNQYQRLQITRDTSFQIQRNLVSGTLTAEEIALSEALKSLFPTYLNGLQLRTGDGRLLTLNPDGSGSFKDYVASLLQASAQKALEAGQDLSQIDWLTVQNNRVVAVDFDRYVRAIGRMKVPPAFDGLSLDTAENELFGTSMVNARHFTAFSLQRSKVQGTLAPAQIVRMMNPLNYLGATGTQSAKYWRIRHGTADRDTSLAVPVIMATKLQNAGYAVDFALPWNQGHGGDYDLDELFAWMDKISIQ